MRTGWYREVVVKSVDSHLVRSLLITRAQLVRMRVDLANQIRGVLKPFGLIAGKGAGGLSPSGCGRWSRAGPCRRWLGRCWRPGRPSASRSRCSAAGSWPWPGRTRRLRRLMTAPGVGVLVALAYVSVVDAPERFAKSSSVGAYIGLTPRRYQSGEADYTGHISRCGDKLLRTYLYEAAGIILHRVPRWSALKAWGTRLARRIGTKKATVAVARKLAVTC